MSHKTRAPIDDRKQRRDASTIENLSVEDLRKAAMDYLHVDGQLFIPSRIHLSPESIDALATALTERLHADRCTREEVNDD